MMVNDTDGYDQVIKTKLGSGTGKEYYKTADGRWWEKWDGEIRTGQELRNLKGK